MTTECIQAFSQLSQKLQNNITVKLTATRGVFDLLINHNYQVTGIQNSKDKQLRLFIPLQYVRRQETDSSSASDIHKYEICALFGISHEFKNELHQYQQTKPTTPYQIGSINDLFNEKKIFAPTIGLRTIKTTHHPHGGTKTVNIETSIPFDYTTPVYPCSARGKSHPEI